MELAEVVKWDGWTDSERRPRPGMPSSHWKPRAPCFFTVRAPAGVDALPQPPLRVKLAAAALALFRDTKTSGPIPAPDSFSASLLDETATRAPSAEPRDLLSFWRSPSANKGRSLVPRSRQLIAVKSRPQSRRRTSRSSHRLTRHFHCQQQRNKQKFTIVGAPSHSIMPSRCCRLPCRLNSHCPSETAGQGCPLLRQLPRATRTTTMMGTIPMMVRRHQCATLLSLPLRRADL